MKMKCIDCKWYKEDICYNCEGFDEPLYGVGLSERIANKKTNCPAFEPSEEKGVCENA